MGRRGHVAISGRLAGGRGDGLASSYQVVGIGNLVDADLGKEAAKLQAAQIRRELAQTLSIANRQPQWLLSLSKGWSRLQGRLPRERQPFATIRGHRGGG